MSKVEYSCYSFLKSHLAVQICTIRYDEYFVDSSEIKSSGALRSKIGNSKQCCFYNSKLMNLFLQVSYKMFSTIFKNTFCPVHE